MELLDRLQAAMRGSYTIDRELSGGAMSHVFLARETALDRLVVVKVVKEERGAGVSTERFQREISIAARLRHPHIVPLLTAGVVDDLLYYTMPFVPGESLRHLMTRHDDLLYYQAYGYLTLGDKKSAIALLAKYFELHPEHAEGWGNDSAWWWRELIKDADFKKVLANVKP